MPAKPTIPDGMRVLLLALASLLAGCSGLPRVTPAEEAWLLEHAARDSAEPTPQGAIPDEQAFLAMTVPMQRFADAAVAGISGRSGRVRALVLAIMSPTGLGLRFD